MAPEPDTLRPEDIEWVDATSQGGAPFRIGVASTAGAAHQLQSMVKSPGTVKSADSIAVDWPLGTEGVWVTPTAFEVDATGIVRYNLFKCDGFIYEYTLRITNTVNYNYYFEDDTGDNYHLNTWTHGDHYVNFNSANPHIKRVWMS